MKYIGICVNDDVTRRSNNDGEDSDDRYRYRGSTVSMHRFTDAVVENQYPHMVIELNDDEPIPATVIIVAVIYDTGDSFGRDIAGQVEFVEAYSPENRQLALQLAELIKHHNDMYCAKESWSSRNDLGIAESKFKELNDTQFARNRGTQITLSNIQGYLPWQGYFEAIADIVVTELPLYVSAGDRDQSSPVVTKRYWS